MDDLAEQFSGMIKRNLNPIRHSGKTVEEVFSHRLSNAKSFEVHNLKSGYLKNQNGNSLLFHFRMIYRWLNQLFCEF
jgi:hypothetical protein